MPEITLDEVGSGSNTKINKNRSERAGNNKRIERKREWKSMHTFG